MNNNRAKIVRMVLDGEIQGNIARCLGISRQRVGQIVKELGLRPKLVGKIPKTLDIESYTASEVAQMYDVRKHNVYLFAKRRGRKLKSPQRRANQ